MNKILGVALALSLIGNVALLYRVLDLGVTTTYGEDEVNRRNQQAADVQKLLPLLMPNMSRSHVLSAAQAAGLEILDKGEEGIYVGSVHFVLSGYQVTAIKFD